jgi:leucyl-tRNA synthetase
MAAPETPVVREALGGPALVLHRKTHATIERVNGDLERFQMNTAIAALMEHVNTLSLAVQNEDFKAEQGSAAGAVLREAVDRHLVLLAPFAPFVAEELWERTGHADTVFRARIPAHDPQAVKTDTVTVIFQVGGKVRGRVEVPAGAGEAEVTALALADENVTRHLGGQQPRRTVYVPGKLLNLVP